jgi:DHA1 family quinolone resistance protein-like MFS transporter
MEADALMVRLAIYSFALMMDTILSSVFFVCMVRLADMQASALAVASFMSVWAIAYMIASLTAGGLVTKRNAGWILVGSCVVSTVVSAGYVLIPGMAAMYLLGIVQGCATAFFFTPFQFFMKLLDENQKKSITHSTGLYTFSWSMGFALGPFIAGFLWVHFGWQSCHLVNGLLAVIMACGIVRLKRFAEAAPTIQAAETPVADHYADMPDLAWMAWVFGGLGCAIMALIRSVFPSSAVAFDLSKPDQGTTFLILSVTQALVGLGLGRGRLWMYRPVPVALFGLWGLAGLGLFATADAAISFYLAAACFGVYSGAFYFYFVFHSLVHPTRAARYVSVNEAIVGLTSIGGPFIGGAIGDRFGLPASYLTAMVVLAMAITIQALRHARNMSAVRRASVLEPPKS